MQLSYWELKNWFSQVTFTVLGGGIVGLHAALHLRKKYPNHKILVVERGALPQGASTKNAGFACFGSLSEIAADLSSHTAQEVVALIEKRWAGLQLLRSTLGDKALAFEKYGGYELFYADDQLYQSTLDQIKPINSLLRPLFKEEVFRVVQNTFGFQKIQPHLIYNPFEGQINPAAMMQALYKQAYEKGILIVNGLQVNDFRDVSTGVEIEIDGTVFSTKKLLIANNGFASKILNEVIPARAQVIITEPIEHLAVKGTFHMDEGYYYFRNVDNRILLGGGRNVDIAGETTTNFGLNSQIQLVLEKVLNQVILPQKKVEIAHRWSGIMGMGKKKLPIVRQLSEHVYCGVRLGGMGIAIGSLVGKELAELITYD